MRDSNSQHAVLETAALPIELIPFYLPLFVFGRLGDAPQGIPLLLDRGRRLSQLSAALWLCFV